jgi:hypothetical protein
MRFVQDWGIASRQADALLAAFDAHLGLIIVPGAAPPPAPRGTLPPPIIPKKKDPNGP